MYLTKKIKTSNDGFKQVHECLAFTTSFIWWERCKKLLFNHNNLIEFPSNAPKVGEKSNEN